MSNYVRISNFGKKRKLDSTNDPLTYCLLPGFENGFLHGGIGPNKLNAKSKECQGFMASYCATEWNDKCDMIADNKEIYAGKPESVSCDNIMKFVPLTRGDVLVRDTAARKYLKSMSDNCAIRYKPFDPTVSESPMVSEWDAVCLGGSCKPIYEVGAEIDSDPVMNRILTKPYIALDILLNIKENMTKSGTIDSISKTKLYDYLHSETFDYLFHFIMDKYASRSM